MLRWLKSISVRTTIAALLLGSLSVSPLAAWNATGHRIVAVIAYDHLTPSARARVDDLIRRHPDYQSVFLREALKDAAPDKLEDPARRARAAFQVAAYWPDLIRNDPRYYDNTRRDATPTPLLPGFPDMGRHTNWHYVDYNFSPDKTPFPPIETPNALTELNRLIPILRNPINDASNPIYALPWVLHIAGDVHNPLHDVSRYTHDLPQGDRGGNSVFVTGKNLHAFWDDLGGTDMTQAYVDKFAAAISSEYKANIKGSKHEKNPEPWTLEGAENARKVTYQFGLSKGSKEHPIALSKSYKNKASRLARQQLATAGFRLAAVLNEQLN